MVVTGVALIQMPFLGWGQRRLGEKLGSSAARSRGAQSYYAPCRPPRFSWQHSPRSRGPVVGGSVPLSAPSLVW